MLLKAKTGPLQRHLVNEKKTETLKASNPRTQVVGARRSQA